MRGSIAAIVSLLRGYWAHVEVKAGVITALIAALAAIFAAYVQGEYAVEAARVQAGGETVKGASSGTGTEGSAGTPPGSEEPSCDGIPASVLAEPSYSPCGTWAYKCTDGRCESQSLDRYFRIRDDDPAVGWRLFCAGYIDRGGCPEP